ncbi:MAG: excalibur calcium-binding domain-containing protein [Chloroflexota bacterium]|nr:excalibur calcium-binding domain-containing protein [Chloroflexota bacterium]
MLTGLESIIQLISSILVIAIGGMPITSLPLDDLPVEQLVADVVSYPVRFEIADPSTTNDPPVSDEPAARQIETGKTEPAANDATRQVILEAEAGDAESLDDVVNDIENLDDALLDPETLDDVYPMLVLPGAETGDIETMDLDSFIVLPGAALPAALDPTNRSARAGNEDQTTGGGSADPGMSGGRQSTGGGRQPTAGDDRNCGDFTSQSKAQAYFDREGGSPENNVAGLDQDNDGEACQDYDYGDQAGGNGGGGGGGGNGGAGGGGSGAGDGGGNGSTGEGNDTNDSSGCRVAVAGRAVAASGCGSGETTVRQPQDASSLTESRDEVIRRGDVRTETNIERSAEGGTEIEIDRGGDNQRSGDGGEPRRSEQSGDDRERRAKDQPDRDPEDQGTTESTRDAEQRKRAVQRVKCRPYTSRTAAASETAKDGAESNVLIDNDYVRVTMTDAGLITALKSAGVASEGERGTDAKQEPRSCDGKEQKRRDRENGGSQDERNPSTQSDSRRREPNQ